MNLNFALQRMGMRRAYLFVCGSIFLCGIAHAKFILMDIPTSTWSWHLWQWLPLLFGAVAFTALGFIVFHMNFCRPLSGFGKFGLFAAPYALAGAGYVLGYHIF